VDHAEAPGFAVAVAAVAVAAGAIGGVPRLYTLYQAGSARNGTLLLHAAPGVQAYDFTFG
jgi:thioredoxin family protein